MAGARASQLGEIVVDELDRHRSVPDGTRDALDRIVADITCGEQARQAGLEQEWLAVEVPALLRPDLGTGEDESARVAGHDALEPGGARLLTDEDKDCAHAQ